MTYFQWCLYYTSTYLALVSYKNIYFFGEQLDSQTIEEVLLVKGLGHTHAQAL